MTVLAAVDTFLARVYGPRKEKKPVMVACNGVDERLEVLIDEVRGMRQAVEQLVALQAENLRLKVAGPSVELTTGVALLGQVDGAADIAAGVRRLITDDNGDTHDAAAIEDAREHGDGRIGKAIKRKVKG